MKSQRLSLASITKNTLFRGNPRTLFAIGLLVISFFAAIAITSQANRSVLVWSATGDLAVGDLIVESDLTKTKVLLPQNALKYLATSAHLTGSIVVRRVGAGELIPSAALSNSPHAVDIRSVPLRVAKNDLPNDLAPGQLVDLYVLPTGAASSNTKVNTALIAHDISVESIDVKARDIGGEIGIVVKISDKFVLKILDSLFSARIVVVRSAI